MLLVAPSIDSILGRYQSTLTQVRENTESLERQYPLALRVQALGSAPRQVIVSMTTWAVQGLRLLGGKGSRAWWPTSNWAGSGSSWAVNRRRS
jgi:hypothetical protein